MWCKNRNLYIGNDEIENKEFYSEASATYAESFDFLK